MAAGQTLHCLAGSLEPTQPPADLCSAKATCSMVPQQGSSKSHDLLKPLQPAAKPKGSPWQVSHGPQPRQDRPCRLSTLQLHHKENINPQVASRQPEDRARLARLHLGLPGVWVWAGPATDCHISQGPGPGLQPWLGRNRTSRLRRVPWMPPNNRHTQGQSHGDPGFSQGGSRSCGSLSAQPSPPSGPHQPPTSPARRQASCTSLGLGWRTSGRPTQCRK